MQLVVIILGLVGALSHVLQPQANDVLLQAEQLFLAGQRFQYGSRSGGPQALELYLQSRAALRSLDGVIELSFDYAGMLNDAGLLLSEVGNNVDAVKIFYEALEVSPRLISVLSNLAHCLAKMGRVERGVSSSMSKYAVDPRSELCFLDLKR